MATFSIIIPVYNVVEYLDKCIQSVINQTYKDLEIILVDDGSTDGSGEKCDNYASEDDRIIVVHKKNGGLSSARNAGIEISTGEYISFIDSDDWYSDNDIFDKLFNRFSLTNADVIVTNTVKCFDDKDIVTCNVAHSMDIKLKKLNSFVYLSDNDLWVASACDKVYKAKIIKDNGLMFELGVTSEDIKWCTEIALFAQDFDYYDITMICYRQRSGSISNSMNYNKIENLYNNVIGSYNIVLNASSEKCNYLLPYLSYCYATIFYNYALMNSKEESNKFITKLKENRFLLKYSKSLKVKLIDIFVTIGGIKFTVNVLRVVSKIRK